MTRGKFNSTKYAGTSVSTPWNYFFEGNIGYLLSLKILYVYTLLWEHDCVVGHLAMVVFRTVWYILFIYIYVFKKKVKYIYQLMSIEFRIMTLLFFMKINNKDNLLFLPFLDFAQYVHNLTHTSNYFLDVCI